MKLSGLVGSFRGITNDIKKWAYKIFFDWFLVGAIFTALYQNGYKLDISLVLATVGNYGTIVSEVINKIKPAGAYLAALF